MHWDLTTRSQNINYKETDTIIKNADMITTTRMLFISRYTCYLIIQKIRPEQRFSNYFDINQYEGLTSSRWSDKPVHALSL